MTKTAKNQYFAKALFAAIAFFALTFFSSLNRQNCLHHKQAMQEALERGALEMQKPQTFNIPK